MSASRKRFGTRLLAFGLAVLMALTMLPLVSMNQAAYAEPEKIGEEVVATAASDSEEFPEPPEALAEMATLAGEPEEGLGMTIAPLAGAHGLTSGVTGLGTIALSTTSAEAGTTVTVTPTPASGQYLAQVRYSSDGGLTYTTVAAQGGAYRFAMPDAAVDVKADFVSRVWDGTIDVTWFDPAATVYTLYYPAQYAGLAALVNGIFTLYPTTPKLDEYGDPVVDIRGPVMLPSYEGFKQGMGVQALALGAPEDSIPASRLYGEFTETYRLNDSQNDYTRTAPITKTVRVIGEPAYIIATCSTGTTGENNMVTTNDFWTGSYDFHDKTVYLGADFDFGGVQSNGVWNTSSPLFMPVGGQYSILPGSGDYTNGYSKLSSSWCGTLDGLGHRMTNVYAEYFANTEYGDAATIGFVGRMGVHDSDPVEIRPFEPKVRQLVLESGYISGRRSTGGIVGKIGKTSASDTGDGSTGGIVEFCINKATLVATDSKGLAGIVASSWNGGIVRYCANFGRIDYHYNNPAGGIVGSNENPIHNSYNVGLITAPEDRYAMGIGSHNGGGDYIVNCYWLTGKSAGGGYYNGDVSRDTLYEFGTGTNIPTLTAALLNGGAGAPAVWYDDTAGINAYEGVNYPRLYFQTAAHDPNITYTVTVSQPATGGTLAASAASARLADTIQLSAAPARGYTLDYFTLNGSRISGNDFVLTSNVTVSAVFRELKSAPLSIEDTTSKPYVISVYKTGVALVNGSLVEVTNQPVLSNAAIYEGDTLMITATLKANVKPEDVNLIYDGQFTGQIKFGNVATFWSSAPFAVSTSHLTNAELGGGTILVSATPRTVPKDWVQVADTTWFDVEDPQSSYTLSTAAQVAGVAKLVNDGTTSFEGITLTLAKNISLANADGAGGTRLWVPIGAQSAGMAFKGVFNGGGYTLRNMSIVKTSGSVAAFFGYLDGATVSDLVVAGTVTGYQYSSGIVSLANNSTISNCVNRAAILTSQSYAGGIVAQASGSTITGCVNRGVIAQTANIVDSQNSIGGIVGRADAATTINACANNAEVTGGYDVGGIVGNLNASTLVESSNTAAVVATLSYTSGGVGGLVGKTLGGAQINRSFNKGFVSNVGATNATYVGGLIGYVTATSMADCYNRGAISTISGAAGGIVGRISATSTAPCRISRTYTTGAVSTTSVGTVAAVAGYVNSSYNTYSNVSYLAGVAGPSGKTNGTENNVGGSSIRATVLSEAELKALPSTLGTAFKIDAQALNDGYPALVWQQPLQPLTGAPKTGDFNGDGETTIAEVITTMRFVLGVEDFRSLTPAQFAVLDMTGDGTLAVLDMQLAFRIAVGL